MLRLTIRGALFSARADGRGGVRGAVVLYVVVAGILWNLLLTEYSMGYTPANILLHIVVPVLVTVDWLVVGRGERTVRWWQPLVWLVYPAAYVVLALFVLNRAGRRAPYYFLDPDSVGIWWSSPTSACSRRSSWRSDTGFPPWVDHGERPAR